MSPSLKKLQYKSLCHHERSIFCPLLQEQTRTYTKDKFFTDAKFDKSMDEDNDKSYVTNEDNIYDGSSVMQLNLVHDLDVATPDTKKNDSLLLSKEESDYEYEGVLSLPDTQTQNNPSLKHGKGKSIQSLSKLIYSLERIFYK